MALWQMSGSSKANYVPAHQAFLFLPATGFARSSVFRANWSLWHQILMIRFWRWMHCWFSLREALRKTT